MDVTNLKKLCRRAKLTPDNLPDEQFKQDFADLAYDINRITAFVAMLDTYPLPQGAEQETPHNTAQLPAAPYQEEQTAGSITLSTEQRDELLSTLPEGYSNNGLFLVPKVIASKQE